MMRPMMRLYALVCTYLFALPILGFAACLENSDFHRYMPKEIGDALLPTPDGYAFTCDTVVVREGDTARVHPANRLYFGKAPTPQSIIWVKGVLKLEGTAKHPIVVAGNVRSSATEMLAPTDEEWGGIRVAKSGKLYLKHVRFHGSAIPIASLSTQVFFDSVYFEDGISILGPEGYQLKLASKGAHLAKTDLPTLLAASNQPVQSTSPRPRPRQGARDTVKTAPKSRLKYWVWGGLGLGLAAGGATVAAMYWPNSDEKEIDEKKAVFQQLPQMADPEEKKRL
jgi:hypothetical protein